LATVVTEGNEQRVTCDVPACRKERRQRGQTGGRFLLSVVWGADSVTITAVCSSCGGTHTVTLPVKQG
jgi:hypothetical protein